MRHQHARRQRLSPIAVSPPRLLEDLEKMLRRTLGESIRLSVDCPATIAPVWAALLTGSAESQGRGSPSDEVRDATVRVPNLWFGDAEEDAARGQRFHVEVYVAPEVAERRVAAAVAAGGTVVDDSNALGLTVIADQDGNRGVLCVDVSAVKVD